MIAAQDLRKTYGPTLVLDGVSFALARGQCLALLGPNGAGKTTLLRLLATLLRPTAGALQIAGVDALREPERVRPLLGVVAHGSYVYEDLTARENLRFWCRLYGIDAGSVDEALDRVGLGRDANTRVAGFSQGMRQRVAVARALLRRAELLLLDEPYAGLDDTAKETVDGLIAETGGRGSTVILATHDRTRGAGAHRTIYVDGGRIVPDPTDPALGPAPRPAGAAE